MLALDATYGISDRLIYCLIPSQCMPEYDTTKSIYLFLHGRMDLREKATASLTSSGFSADKIIMAKPDAVGSVGDYMAMLWRPPQPDHIKIQKITKVQEVKPEGMIGLWKGVTSDVIDTISM